MSKLDKPSETIKGYKGFDKDFKCRGKLYESGKDFTEDKAVACETGMHFCENPLDVFAYYPAGTSRFAEVEGGGEVARKADDTDTKVSSTYLKVGAEITLHKLIDAGISFIFERAKTTKKVNNAVAKQQCSNSGYRGAASNSGYSGAASNSGYSGAASNSGDRGAAFTIAAYSRAETNAAYSRAETNAAESVAVGVGYQNTAKASLGSWIVLAERNDRQEIISIQSVKVDGKEIEADTWYILKSGKLTKS